MRFLSLLWFLGLFLFFNLLLPFCCAEKQATIPKDYPLWIIDTWTRKIGEYDLEIDLVRWASGLTTGEVVLLGDRGRLLILDRERSFSIPFLCRVHAYYQDVNPPHSGEAAADATNMPVAQIKESNPMREYPGF